MKFILFIFLFLFWSCRTDTKLIVATSANMKDAMESIVKEYNKKKAIHIQLIIGSSGKLASQIEYGAPYDLFVAANLKYPEYLYEKGKAVSPPKKYASGKLVLWSFNNVSPFLSSLETSDVEKIAIANPKTAPYGEATIELLKKNNIFDKVKSKLVYGESISQCNQFITNKVVDIGVTSQSSVFSLKNQDKGYWREIDISYYTPIQQGVILLSSSTEKEEAIQFYNFLFSQTSQNILSKFGYIPIEKK